MSTIVCERAVIEASLEVVFTQAIEIGDRTLTPILTIRLFGAFALADETGAALGLRSSKLRALIAMLATAPEGRRTRAWLQEKLWGRSGHEHGRASLRRGLTDLRRVFGDQFAELFEVNNSEIRLRLDRVKIVGTTSDGAFLEGLDVSEESFESWLDEQRQSFKLPERGAPHLRPVPSAPAQAIDHLDAHRNVSNLMDRYARDKLRPSLAILPFSPARGHAGSAMLGDMIAEEMTRALSRSPMLDMISHLSCRKIDSRTADLSEIHARLKADFVVWGTFKTQGDRFTLRADLLEAKSGLQRWTDEITGSTRGFLRGDDDLVRLFAEQFGRALMDTSVEVARSAPLSDIESHALLMSGITMMHKQNDRSFHHAEHMLEEVCARMPKSAIARAWLAKWHALKVIQGWSQDRASNIRSAQMHAEHAVAMVPDCAFSLTIDGFVHNNLLKKLDVAMNRYVEAIEIDPSNALAWLLKGTLHAFKDEGAMAVSHVERACSLSPLDPHKYFFDSLSATAYLSAGDFDRAYDLAAQSLKANRRHTSTLRALAVSLVGLDRMDEARASVKDLLQLEPNLRVSTYLKYHPAANYEAGRSWARALELAGVPY